jgi:hypothetical protein
MSAPHLWRGFNEIVRRLAMCGVPRPGHRWMEEVERFYLHPTARTWIACCGRGAGKNFIGVLCDLTELVYEDFEIPPGETHYIVHNAADVDEAEKTLRQMAQYLAMLGIEHTAKADAIHLLDPELANRAARVEANRISANSGYRGLGGTTQEIAKWNNQGTNPAEEVVTSWVAQMVTHPRARRRHFSTPMSRDGFFFDQLSKGDTPDQIVTRGPSWLFNPTITEAHCRTLATSDRVFRREYCAEPQAGVLSAFDADAIDRAFAHPRRPGVEGRHHVIFDPSSGKKDAATFADCCWVMPPKGETWSPYLRFNVIDGIEGSFWQTVNGDALADRVAALAKKTGAKSVHADQREELMMRSALEKRGFAYDVHPWTATSKPLGVERVRRWFADDGIALIEHPKMRAELLAFEERISPSGAFTFGARGSGHDDYVALLITAALAELDGDLRCVGPGAGFMSAGRGAPSNGAQIATIFGRGEGRGGGQWWR